MSRPQSRVRELDAARWRVALGLTAVVPGLTLGILLGALVIVISWLLTWVYVRWAATHYDPRVEALSRGEEP